MIIKSKEHLAQIDAKILMTATIKNYLSYLHRKSWANVLNISKEPTMMR